MHTLPSCLRPYVRPQRLRLSKTMATVNSSLSHLERTATEPRDNALHRVTISQVKRVNDSIRLFQLKPTEGESIKYLPGQWLDVHVPGIPKAGGFTITSSPPLLMRKPVPQSPPKPRSNHLELAIQRSPNNPPAAWLWQDSQLILGKELNVRVGGSFVWPPDLLRRGRLKRAVFIAGGVGINPLISMVTSIAEIKVARGGSLGFDVKFLYMTRNLPDPREILFLPRLMEIFRSLGEDGDLKLFLTNRAEPSDKKDEDSLFIDGVSVPMRRSRIGEEDLEDAIGKADSRSGTVCYVCGVPSMTDVFVGRLKAAEGMEEQNVLSEKWW